MHASERLVRMNWISFLTSVDCLQETSESTQGLVVRVEEGKKSEAIQKTAGYYPKSRGGGGT